ncbi:hypothetical protein LguiA_028336 [Lonicera macranthoides]
MAASTSILNSPPNPPPPQLIPLPLTSFSPLSISPPPPPPPTMLSHSLKTTQSLFPVPPKHSHTSLLPSDLVSVLYPSLPYSNTLFFKSGFNVQIMVDDNEPEEEMINRFRREVFRAGILQEIKRRRFFETTRDKRKRKSREASKRNRKRRFPPKTLEEDHKLEAPEEEDSDEEDNWEFIDTPSPLL